MGAENKPKDRRIRAVAVILALVCLCLAGILVWKSWDGKPNLSGDSKTEDGLLPGMTEQEIQEEMDRKVAEGELAISINSELSFPDGKSEGYVRIENSKSNHYTVTVEIDLLEEGTCIYKTGGIKPGAYIEKDKLDKELEKGEYPVVVRFMAYDAKEQYVGEANAEMTVTVEN